MRSVRAEALGKDETQGKSAAPVGRSQRKEGWMAARAFVKHFNKKLYTCDDRSEINWSLWYFPLITTDKSLKVIDQYMQDCIRYIATGSRTKSRFDFRYEQMKELGLITLVNEWYSYNTKPGEHSVC